MKKFNKTLFISLVTTLAAMPAFAADPSQAGTLGLAAGLAIAIAAVGGALGQSKAAAAALEGIARNPAAQDKLFVPMIIALALIESLVIYALIVAFKIAP